MPKRLTNPKYINLRPSAPLTDLRGKKVGIDLIMRRLTDDQHSHVLSWVMLRVNQLRRLGIDIETIHEPIKPQDEYDVWQKYDVVFIYHDMAMQQFVARNIVNVYDVALERSAWFFERLIWEKHKNVQLISMDFPMIPYGLRCAYKAPRPAVSDYWKNMDWDALQAKCDSIDQWVLDPAYDYTDKVTHLTIGDSHAHSAYKPDSFVLRKDARTLRGILKKGILNEAEEHGFSRDRIKSLTAYYGSIDIRHHLCREPDPAEATTKLLAEYEQELKRCERHVEVCCPLPIEDESRVVPKMGWYKGQGFYGSRAERVAVLERFIGGLHEMAARNGWDVFQWPKDWYEMDPIEFMGMMEKPRSVHLGWKNYRWDLQHDRPNPLHSIVSKATSLLEF